MDKSPAFRSGNGSSTLPPLLVYRIESSKGHGPYQHVFMVEKIRKRTGRNYGQIFNIAQTAPHPNFDVPGWVDLPNRWDYMFGGESIEQLVRFFDPRVVLYLITYHSYHLATYEAKDYLIGRTQIAFSRYTAIRKSRRKLKVLLPLVADRMCEDSCRYRVQPLERSTTCLLSS